MSSKVKFYLILTIWALALSACTTLTDRADKLLEAGEFDEAIKTYKLALAKDSSNHEAIIGLKKAKRRWIDTSLLRVRRLRLGRNFIQAADLLVAIITRQEEWGLGPEDAAAFTQEDEIDLLGKYITKKVLENKDQHPVVSQQLLNSYRDFYKSPERVRLYPRLRKDVSIVGKKNCRQLLQKPKPQLPYYTNFITQYCGYWGINAGKTDLARLTANNSSLYSKIELTGSMANLGPNARGLFIATLQNALKASPWFNAYSQQALPVKLSGKFKHNYHNSPGSELAYYTVEVPYTAYETVDVPYEETYTVPETTYNASTGKTETNYVKKSYTNYRKEQREVTRYRSETRSQLVYGYNYQQDLLILGEVAMTLGKSDILVPINNQKSTAGFSHKTSIPSRNISPKADLSVEPLTWLRDSLKKAQTDIRAATHQAWRNNYCGQSVAGKTTASLINSSVRCLQLPNVKMNQEVDNWFIQNHGLSLRKLSQEIGGAHSSGSGRVQINL